MPRTTLSQFALCTPADFQYLRQRVDTCAQTGCSYVFKECILPPGAEPPAATVGFLSVGGGYAIYVTPQVRYTGTNINAARLFRGGREEFATFEGLTAFLRGMEAPPAPRPDGAQPAPAYSAETLTEPERVTPPKVRQAPVPGYHLIAHALRQSVMGQDAAVEAAAFKLYTHISKQYPARPLSLIFHGPTGVGKSELGKQIAPVLNRFMGAGTYQFVWTELNTFTEPHSVYRLIGAPPGYVGYDDKPVFEAASGHPKTVFMFDELEKAHPEVLKTFMSVLDEGRCAARRELAGKGRELDFRQCIFLFTTNADLAGSGVSSMGFSPAESACPQPSAARIDVSRTPEDAAARLADRIFAANERGRKALTASGTLREIAGRFGGFIEFTPLSAAANITILAKQIADLGLEYGLHITYVAPAILQELLDRMGTESFSVRSNASVIEGYFTVYFLKWAALCGDARVRLEGTLAEKQLIEEPSPTARGTAAP